MDYTVFDKVAGAFPKDSKEEAVLRRRKDKADVEAHEKKEKAKVVKRDGSHYCRLVPGCEEREKHETAHLDDKGMGGDKLGIRTVAELMVRACLFHHQGKFSLHSNDLRVEFLTPQLANGPIAVWAKNRATNDEYLLGRETAVCQWERD